MALQVWVGFVEVRQLPGDDHLIMLSGKGAYTWIACWAADVENYEAKVATALGSYGLFVVEVEEAMPFAEFTVTAAVGDELADLYERVRVDSAYCIYGTFHNYMQDH